MNFASRYLLIAVVIAGLAGLTGCSNFRFPGVHKIHVQQGHIITDEMVQQLQEGQTRRQVRFILGNSLLPDTFNDDRWNYYYSLRHGEKTLRKHLFTVYFENDVLTRWDGDYVRGPAPASGEKSDQYLEDSDLNSPLPTNIDEQPPEVPEAPEVAR